MRRIFLGKPVATDPQAWRKWAEECFAEIERAADDDLASVAQDFSATNHTNTRTLDAATASLADVTNVLCTLIQDLRNRGMKRSQ